MTVKFRFSPSLILSHKVNTERDIQTNFIKNEDPTSEDHTHHGFKSGANGHPA